MVTRAEAKYIRISPAKVRQVIGLIKGKYAQEALSQLELLNKKGAYFLRQVLKSAVSNAKNKGYAEGKLFISKIAANSGPTLKRYKAKAFGSASLIRKRTAHILIELDSPEKIVEKAKPTKRSK